MWQAFAQKHREGFRNEVIHIITKRDYALAIITEAARLFGHDPAMLFAGQNRPDRTAVEDAIIYTLWLTHADRMALGKYLGVQAGMGRVRDCIAHRKASPKYNELCGELVWFAQCWNDIRRAA